MPERRRRFNPQFKAEAVQLVIETGEHIAARRSKPRSHVGHPADTRRHEHIPTTGEPDHSCARDLPALRNFYRTLGWPQIVDDGEFVAFELRGIVLALFPLAKLARDGNTHPEPGTGGIRFTIGVMVDSADEVDRLTEQMRAAGARVTKEPIDAEFFTGRSAYLCDPEGNYFEIAWADAPDNAVVIATRRAAGA